MKRGSCCALFQIMLLTHTSLVKMMPIDYYTPSFAGLNCNFTRFPLFFFCKSVCRVSSELQLTKSSHSERILDSSNKKDYSKSHVTVEESLGKQKHGKKISNTC